MMKALAATVPLRDAWILRPARRPTRHGAVRPRPGVPPGLARRPLPDTYVAGV